ncbi:hypothetical protein IV38_GL001232 [Lactobacillus selangorensis]|uniref:CAAX prenyl protease 2/Lysostaphin resistance protein A-like domain-containing protein n=1 Tax=Lactobacillus selangorensis TaxID=81857 RepID=A0A0R2G7A6_9LACO|nr:hypothetical protein IV38_GL001232 [Lactobacillus selangorensis]KRN32573.1 hypothetical protein IV40_GL000621 [Lactobacillus selangorensis]
MPSYLLNHHLTTPLDIGIGYVAFFGLAAAMIYVLVQIFKQAGGRKPWRLSQAEWLKTLLIFALARITAAVLSVVNQLLSHETTTQNDAAWTSLLTSGKAHPSILILLMVYLIIIAPILEELLFRGILMNLFWPDSFWVPILISATVFGLAHQSNTFSSFLIYFSMGAFFAYLYRSTGNLYTDIIAHMTNNLLAAVTLIMMILH